MGKLIDLKGKKFNRLTVVELNGKNKHNHYNWLCKCECGNKKVVDGYCLRKSLIKSCGCLGLETQIENGKNNKTHGMTDTSEYNTWRSIKARCFNEKERCYKNYGGRGITVCDRWIESFENFYEDMGKRPEDMSIDRIDNEKGYCKENCRWSTCKEQQNNRRSNVFITYEGETKTLAQWTRKYKFNRSLLGRRLRDGWSIEDLFNKPVR